MEIYFLALHLVVVRRPLWQSGLRPLGGLWVRRLMNLPFFMVSFQLAILPLDSFSGSSPAVIAALITYSQYCWLLILLSSNLEVSIPRHVIESRIELSFNLLHDILLASSLIAPLVWLCFVILWRIQGHHNREWSVYVQNPIQSKKRQKPKTA